MLSLSFAMVNQSFRYQSTAGLFADDYDLLFDPARISEIQGSRLWTNLSNFVSSYEYDFSNGSVPYILLGGTTNFGKVYPGLIYDRSNDKHSMITGLHDVYGNDIYGNAKVTTIDWNDLDNNGIFDQRLVSNRTASAFDYTQLNDMYLAAGIKLTNLRLGLGFLHNEYKDIFTTPGNNFTFDTTAEDLTTSTTTFAAHGGFGGDDVYNYGNNTATFSGWLDKEKMRYGLSASYDMYTSADKAIILGDSAIHSAPADTTTFHTAVHVLDSINTPQSGSEIDVKLAAFYNYNEKAQGRFYLGIYTGSYNLSSSGLEYFHNGRLNHMNTTYTWDTTNTWTRPSGGGNEKGINLGTKQLFTVSDRLKFGIGLLFSTGTYYDSTASKDTSVAVRVFDNNNGIPDPNDYVRTTWSSETWMNRLTGKTFEVSIPVGVEFYLAQPLVFRLGAEHTYTINDYTTIDNQIQYEPQRVRTVDGIGTVTETIIDPGAAPIGSLEYHYDKIPLTNYYYGIGWAVTSNLQVDLMGFAKLTDLTNWRLSATLKF
jgi:hypothetical protein